MSSDWTTVADIIITSEAGVNGMYRFCNFHTIIPLGIQSTGYVINARPFLLANILTVMLPSTGERINYRLYLKSWQRYIELFREVSLTLVKFSSRKLVLGGILRVGDWSDGNCLKIRWKNWSGGGGRIIPEGEIVRFDLKHLCKRVVTTTVLILRPFNIWPLKLSETIWRRRWRIQQA